MSIVKTDSLKLSDGTGVGARDDKFWENAVRLTERRMALIASNIANGDTPNFKARDIDFKAALQQSMSGEHMKMPHAEAGFSSKSPMSLSPPALFRVPRQGSVDGNTVDLNVEQAAFAENAILYEFALQKAVGEYKEMSELFKSLVN